MSSSRAQEAQKLRSLRRAVARARAALAARMKRLRAAAKRYRASARRRVRAWYQAELAKLRAERARRYAEIGETVRRKAAALKERAALARAQRKLDEHRRVLEALRAVRGDRAGRTAEARAEHARKAREAREASREEVVREIEHHDRSLLPVWEKVGARIKATPRKSRSEAFFEWVQANPEEVIRIQADAGDREAAALWKEQEQATRELAAEKARRAQQREARRRTHVAASRRGKGRERRRVGLRIQNVRVRHETLLGHVMVPTLRVFYRRRLVGEWPYDPKTWRLGVGSAPREVADWEYRAAREAALDEMRKHAEVPF